MITPRVPRVYLVTVKIESSKIQGKIDTTLVHQCIYYSFNLSSTRISFFVLSEMSKIALAAWTPRIINNPPINKDTPIMSGKNPTGEINTAIADNTNIHAVAAINTKIIRPTL